MTASPFHVSAIEPMEARLADDLPLGADWSYEPKWDGFRCIAFVDGAEVALYSKAGKSLSRYFPDMVAALASTGSKACILDGELVVEIGGRLSFEALQARLHPAESRVRRLAGETPSHFILFDCLQAGDWLADKVFSVRRTRLERVAAGWKRDDLRLSPSTRDPLEARRWLERSGGDTDGVVAKRLDIPYAPGERAMVKVKRRRTADCVVGGFRYAASGEVAGSLLLGLYDSAGRLNHVGYTSSMSLVDRRALTPRLEALIEPPGFTGDAPGGPSRWSSARSAEWQPLKPELVVEVLFDHVTGGRFRHGTRFLRWRPDKAPRQCRMEQLAG